ncbi:hypothetical protein JL720_5554 [Aureococcus anophagefferens]|nr:hypothetical protein JL720_5554 [Aureococcus anophagefferens]
MWRKVALERYHGDPPMRSQSATTVMGSKLYVFGGLGAGASNNLWALDSVMHRWQRLLPPKGAPRPPARSGSAMCGDEEQGKLYLLGGLGEVNRRVKKSREGVPGATMRVRMLAMRDTFSDCWEFDAASGEWREITFVQMSPPPRRGHTCSFASGYKLADAADEQNDAGARSEDALSQTGGPTARATSLGDTTPPPVAELLPSHEDLEDTVTIRAIRVTDDVPLMRKLPTRGQPPPPSYGMVCLPWNGHKLSMSKLRRDRGAELEERGIDGFSSSELYLYDCLWAPPESESDADPDDAPEDLLKDLKKDADSVQRPDDDRSRASFGDHASLGDHGSLALLPNGGLSFAPSTESGPGGASSSSRAAQKKSEADLRFFLDQLEVHGGELPGGYDAMKQIILQRRPDHTTSKLRRGEKVPRAPPWLAASQGHGTKGLNASHSNRSLHGAAGDAPGSADAPGEKGLTRTHTAPAGLGRPSASGLGRPSTSNSTLLDPLDARSTISAHAKAMPSGSTIWRARDLFQYDVAMASLTRPRTAFSETQ